MEEEEVDLATATRSGRTETVVRADGCSPKRKLKLSVKGQLKVSSWKRGCHTQRLSKIGLLQYDEVQQ